MCAHPEMQHKRHSLHLAIVLRRGHVVHGLVGANKADGAGAGEVLRLGVRRRQRPRRLLNTLQRGALRAAADTPAAMTDTLVALPCQGSVNYFNTNKRKPRGSC